MEQHRPHERERIVAYEADPTEGVRPAEDPAAEATPTDSEATEVAGPLTRADLRVSGGGRTERVGLAVVVAAAMLMIGFVLGRASVPDRGNVPTSATATTLPLTAAYPAGDQDRTGYWRFAGINAVVVDDFERPDGPLGSTVNGDEWNIISGAWAIGDGHAVVTDERAQPSLAIISGGTANRLTEATVVAVEPGAGIIFRYRDLANYWSLTADPANAGWALEITFDGDTERVASIPGATEDGTSIGVAQRGDELQLLVDGLGVTRMTDARLSSQARSGLVGPAGTSGDARWDRFYVGDILLTG